MEHFLFARGEFGLLGLVPGGPGGRQGLLERLDHQAGDLAGHRRGTVDHILRRGHQLAPEHRLVQVAAGTRFERPEDGIGVVIDRQHDHQDAGQFGNELPHALHAVHPRQIDVHEHHPRLQGRQVAHRLLAVRARGDHADGGRGAQHFTQRFAQFALVLDNGNGDGVRRFHGFGFGR